MKRFFLIVSVALFSFFNAFTQNTDSLRAKRIFLSTYVYSDSARLSKSNIINLLKENPKAKVKYKWANILKPIGPVVALGGISLAFIALKGVDASAEIDGKMVDYKIRSLTKLLAGLGLLAGGVCMIESSNELVQHSVDIYNSTKKNRNTFNNIDKIKFGITESNAVGFSISLK
ncbi:hypothetical protein EMA8858_00277 [Emticicia aquatica]|jgi:hypothetical protein|uniref:Uncharacterized protein n=1 Tax=Emticicia aquatica TaxID=1681835 RepID=A0ABN8EMT0_9BACT|nr:hypothetical protein [Emticicia aquatica]CAH0994169.1 hypothetical protein EMA8858_00277 [Emticicia aquatica]